MSTYSVHAPDYQVYGGLGNQTKAGEVTEVEGFYISIDEQNLYVKDSQSAVVAVFAAGCWAKVVRSRA